MGGIWGLGIGGLGGFRYIVLFDLLYMLYVICCIEYIKYLSIFNGLLIDCTTEIIDNGNHSSLICLA